MAPEPPNAQDHRLALTLLALLALLLVAGLTPRPPAVARSAQVARKPSLRKGLGLVGDQVANLQAQAREAEPSRPTRGQTTSTRAQARKGVALGLFSSASDPAAQRAHYGLLLDEIAALGATDVSIVVRWGQPTVRSAALGPVAGVTTPDETVRWVIEAARRRGLRVFLLPIITVRARARGVWRGTIAPDDLEVWWSAYARFIMHYARLSQASGVSLLAVGSELLSREADEARWRQLIAQVRAEAPQVALTYSANWDHFEHVPFWDALDVVGMTAYHELAEDGGPTDAATLAEAWHAARWRVKLWAGMRGARVLITEVGYPAAAHGAARPWDHTSRSTPDHALQARCYEAMIDAWRDDPDLAGIYVWNWFGRIDPSDTSYSPRGKPAAALLKRWYTAKSRP